MTTPKPLQLKSHKCPMCDKMVDVSKLRTKDEIQEYKLNRTCKECQLKMYGPPIQ